jgi:hypothetical protein
MTRTLRDVLHERAERLREQAAVNRELREEWVASVARLMRQFEGWIKETDEDKVLEVVQTSHGLAEPGLGRYQAPGLKVYMGHREITIWPKERSFSKKLQDGSRSQGAVCMSGGWLSTSFLRVPAEGGERWV